MNNTERPEVDFASGLSVLFGLCVVVWLTVRDSAVWLVRKQEPGEELPIVGHDPISGSHNPNQGAFTEQTHERGVPINVLQHIEDGPASENLLSVVRHDNHGACRFGL